MQQHAARTEHALPVKAASIAKTAQKTVVHAQSAKANRIPQDARVPSNI